ncbi:MAG: hypothetical protein IJS40_00715 [Synergistaceae bacterium]|nr:hypothetical protein [Synergistaceae bacterium]
MLAICVKNFLPKSFVRLVIVSGLVTVLNLVGRRKFDVTVVFIGGLVDFAVFFRVRTVLEQ